MSPTTVEEGQTQILAEAIDEVEPHGLDCTAFVQEALAEIKAVPPAMIHRASALRWSARAIASYRICAESKDHEDRLCYLYLGEHYREAALAHAAMGEPWEPLYAAIDDAMQMDRSNAFDEAAATPPQLGRTEARRPVKKAG